MLDDYERVSFLAQRGKRVEQPQIIARMQANRRFIKHVKHTAQIRTKLRGQTNPLRFAAAQGFRRTPERQISEPDVFHKAQSLPNFGQQLRCDRLVRAAKSQLVNFPCCFAGRKRSQIVDGATLHPHMARHFVQA